MSQNIYTISSDTKIVSKILEIHLFPRILQFAQDNGYSIVLAEHQNWYPDLSFVKQSNRAINEVIHVKELDSEKSREPSHRYRVTSVDHLRSIASVVKDLQFFVCEKWRLASDKQGSGNTANIGSITYVDDILAGNGVFAKLGEEWFDEYWMNNGISTMIKKGKATPIRSIEDFLDFKGKGNDKNKIVPMNTKKKTKKVEKECE